MLVQGFIALAILLSAWLVALVRESAMPSRRGRYGVAAGLIFGVGSMGLAAQMGLAAALATAVLYMLLGIPVASLLLTWLRTSRHAARGRRTRIAQETAAFT